MKKIDLMEILDEQPKIGEEEDWKDVVKRIERDSNNYDLETMCQQCIQKQLSLGIKDSDGKVITPIQCTGLQTYKNNTISQYGEAVYDRLLGMLTDEQKEAAEQTANPMTWMENAIPDKNIFSPRPYQVLINSCSSKKKVLRMGRRCVEEKEKITGVKKDYTVKHLFHLFKHHKKMPAIVTYDDEKGELVETDQYLVMPNGIEPVYKVKTTSGHSITATAKHPLLVYSNKQYEYKEIGEISIEYDKLLFIDNKLHTIESIKYVGMRNTYHISVVKYETFSTKGGFLHHNTGKALDVRTLIPTPFGWKTMGDLTEGDVVFDDNGKPCNVTYVTEYQLARDCYEITFDNGDKIVADGDHQWNVNTPKTRKSHISIEEGETTLTTKDMLLNFNSNHLGIRTTDPIKYNRKEYNLDPYLYGINIKKEVLNREDILGDTNQRLALLRGILNGYGSILRDTYSIHSKDNDFKSFVKELISSLGLKGSIGEDRVSFKGDISSERNLYNNKDSLLITSIVKVETRPVKCISVDSERSLYLASENYIVTHNTFSMSVGLLHRLLVNKGYRVLMVAPMETMIIEVVEQIKKFCAAMEEDPITGYSQSPIHQINFNTGSTFKGVTAGASGAKGTRGKGADLLYVDECFPAKTKIRLPDGSSKNIEDINVGDRILSFNETTKKLVPRLVAVSKEMGKKEIFTYTTVSGRKITCTADHPVYTREGWSKACEATSLATIDTRSGSYFFESIVKSEYKGKEIVYNLEVKGTHTFIANGFIVHNCDFLRVKDMNSILGILLDSKKTELWVSSTPIGESNLHKLSQDPTFKEFHYPSYVIPHYSDESDVVLRAQMDEAGYVQEVKAEFGSDNQGVYPLNFIEQATIKEHTVINMEYINRNRKDFIFIMGVDWNHDRVGTRIVIVAYHKMSGRYFPVIKERVALTGWTQPLAVEKIVDLNRLHNVDHIYVDEGFGVAQASQLRLFSQSQYGKVPPNHPDLKLSRVVSVSFGSTITVRDPISGDEYRKATKQYMVEHSVDLLTRGLVVLHEKDDADIIAQMKNYLVKSKTATGLKTYMYRDAQIGDHDLDAFNLALHGFHTEYSELNSVSSVVGISSIMKGNGVASDEGQVISYGTNMIINTTQSLATSKFRQQSSKKQFKTRKKW